MSIKNRYIYFKSILEMLQNNINICDNTINKYKKKNKQLSEDDKKKIKGDLFEIFANSHCFEKGHISLISTYEKRNGYDGIYLNEDNDIYFMEAKYHNNKFNNIFPIANKTITKNLESRAHEIDDSKNTLKGAEKNSKGNYIFNRKNYMTGEEKDFIIKIDENLKDSIQKLDKYFESISHKKTEHTIEDMDKVFYLANNEIGDELTHNHKVRKVICVTIKREEI